jgi:dTDP-4-amino-4,6-dideoxygalactose transaminase
MKSIIEMVSLTRQTAEIIDDINVAIAEVLGKSNFINGSQVKNFENNLAAWLNDCYVVSCANGTDALQLALMALELKVGDEVLVPAFTYVATAEVIALLGLKPILVEVHPDTFNINISNAAKLITNRTKAIIPVHLYGQSADMEAVMNFARMYDLFVVEDTAQAIGAEVTFSDGSIKKAGTIGHIGTTSFFPSKNLGCFGDGGAIFTHDSNLAERLRMIANHGQKIKYFHDIVGINSRLDTIQAAILDVKLKHLGSYCDARRKVAAFYDSALSDIEEITIPTRSAFSTHVFHQYTIKVGSDFSRDDLKNYLFENGIPSMIYYPLPLHKQKAYEQFVDGNLEFPISTSLCQQVISLPMHTHLKLNEIEYIVLHVKKFFNA